MKNTGFRCIYQIGRPDNSSSIFHGGVLFSVSQYPSCLSFKIHVSFIQMPFIQCSCTLFSLELIQFFSLPVQFPLLDLFLFPPLFDQFLVTFILAFCVSDLIGLCILKPMLCFALLSHTNCSTRNQVCGHS